MGEEMSSTSVRPIESEDTDSRRMLGKTGKTQGVIAWSSLFFVLLQSVCTFFTALDGLRVVIGAGALAGVVETGEMWDKFHADWLRVPMVGLALAGALLNLVMLRRIRRLRDRPAARWRQRPLAPQRLRRERVQFVLAILTLALIGIEEVTHWHTFHRL
jgi:hypothetical protein